MTDVQAQAPDLLNLADAAEMLWVVLANVSGGDWKQQTPEWQEAAARWRDAYFAAVKALPVCNTHGQFNGPPGSACPQCVRVFENALAGAPGQVRLSPEDSRVFAEALVSPPAPNDRLKHAAAVVPPVGRLTQNDRVIALGILERFDRGDTTGLNLPGVSRLFRKYINFASTEDPT